ncbi:unnamed protein product [Musa acuminata subsp. malaccensis]|uniref:(wild Malaysian banana) hypothetical protein n=1 Tax=Musa acuminata subsp. malaccensis TaxID=214687 RepID=A0A804HPQ8_MUSAM|nr:unnamed protein product [Musa acuminata subsp. malaccensis]
MIVITFININTITIITNTISNIIISLLALSSILALLDGFTISIHGGASIEPIQVTGGLCNLLSLSLIYIYIIIIIYYSLYENNQK